MKRQEQAAGDADPSYTSYFMEKSRDRSKYQDEVLKYSAATIFAGGSDTASSLEIFSPFKTNKIETS